MKRWKRGGQKWFRSLVHCHLESKSRDEEGREEDGVARRGKTFGKSQKHGAMAKFSRFAGDLIKTFASFVALRSHESASGERRYRNS